jgi:hypothetical protein
VFDLFLIVACLSLLCTFELLTECSRVKSSAKKSQAVNRSLRCSSCREKSFNCNKNLNVNTSYKRTQSQYQQNTHKNTNSKVHSWFQNPAWNPFHRYEISLIHFSLHAEIIFEKLQKVCNAATEILSVYSQILHVLYCT